MRLPMQTEYRAIVQSEYGAPEKVLRIAKRQLKSEELGADDVMVKVSARPVHPGDIQILSGLPQGGPVVPIPEGSLRIPGFEGVGTIARVGRNIEAVRRFRLGRRVAIFSAMGALAHYIILHLLSPFPIPASFSHLISVTILPTLLPTPHIL